MPAMSPFDCILMLAYVWTENIHASPVPYLQMSISDDIQRLLERSHPHTVCSQTKPCQEISIYAEGLFEPTLRGDMFTFEKSMLNPTI